MSDDALNPWLHRSVRVTMRGGSQAVGRVEHGDGPGMYHLIPNVEAKPTAVPGVQVDGTGPRLVNDFSADDVVNIEDASSGLT